MQNSSLSEIDVYVENNQQNASFMEKFLTQKQMELSELQNFLLQEFQDMETWKDQRDRLIHLFNHEIKNLFSQFRSFCTLLTKQFQSLIQSTLQQSISPLTSLLKSKQSIIENQKQQINRLRQEVQIIGIKSQSNFLEIKRQTSQRNMLSKSTFLQNLSGSKSKENLRKTFANYEKFNYQKSGLTKSPSITKQIMREVQRNLKQDYGRQKSTNSGHKKYVKQKIQQMKMKNSGIFYENTGMRRF